MSQASPDVGLVKRMSLPGREESIAIHDSPPLEVEASCDTPLNGDCATANPCRSLTKEMVVRSSTLTMLPWGRGVAGGIVVDEEDVVVRSVERPETDEFGECWEHAAIITKEMTKTTGTLSLCTTAMALQVGPSFFGRWTPVTKTPSPLRLNPRRSASHSDLCCTHHAHKPILYVSFGPFFARPTATIAAQAVRAPATNIRKPRRLPRTSPDFSVIAHSHPFAPSTPIDVESPYDPSSKVPRLS